MSKRFSVVISVAALVLALAAPVAAQSPRLTANVPFEFRVGTTVLPAGEYAIQNGTEGSVVVLRNFESRVGALVVATRNTDSFGDHGVAKLIFNRYGDSYFLSRIWYGFTGLGNTLPVTRTEQELSRTASVQKFEVLAFLARR